MPECSPQLMSVILIDQRERWTKGERPPVETYLRDVPELSTDREGLLDFIYQEVLLREESGDVPSADDYARRFPDLNADLKIQFEVHRHLPRQPKSARAPDSAELPKVDGFVISELIGRGGFGVVYRAWDQSLKRTVALKLLTERAEPGRKNRSRFADEAQAAARLSHPNIVQIHSVNAAPELSYFCLEHVEGGTLADFLQGRPQSVREAAECVATLARAVHYAHLCHVVHCDLKPANILLQHKTDSSRRRESNGDGEAAPSRPPVRLQDFDAKITDFGLARRLDTEGGLESVGLAGTLPYMAPEQLSGEAAQAAPAVDIYALGAILYEMLTGRPPFVNDSILQVFLSVRGGSPKAPRGLRADIPEDLNAICLKCLETDPSKRYPTAQALADDLNLFLEGREVSVFPLNWPQRADRWRRRNPLPAALVGLLIAVTAVSFVVVTAKMLQARRAERSERKRADELDATLYLNEFLLADMARRNNDAARASRKLDETNPARRSFEWGFLKRTIGGKREVWPVESKSLLNMLTVSPDGRWGVVSDAVENTTLFDAKTGKPAHALKGHAVQLSIPVFSPDSALIASAGMDEWESFARLWDVATGEERKKFGPLAGTGIAVAFVNDGRQLMTLSVKRSGFDIAAAPVMIEVWDLATGKRASSTRGEDTNQPFTPKGRLSTNGRRFAWTGSMPTPAGERGGHLVMVGDSSTGKVLHALKGHKGQVHGMSFSPDGEQLATFAEDGKVILWNVGDGRQLAELTGHADAVFGVAYSVDGRQIATASRDRTVRIWDTKSGSPLEMLQGLEGPAWAVAFSPTHPVLMTSGKSEVSSWPLNSSTAETTPIDRAVMRLALTHDGKFLVAAILGGEVRIYDRTAPGRPKVFDRPYLDFALSDDGSAIAAVDAEGKLWIVELGDSIGEPVRIDGVPPLNSSAADTLAWKPAGRQIAAVLADQTSIACVDTTTRETRWTIKTPHGSVTGLTFRADGGQLATTGKEETEIQLWDAATGTHLRSIAAGTPIRELAYRPGSHDLAAIPVQGQTVGVWDSETGKQRIEFQGHKLPITCIACTPDGKRFVTGSSDRTVKVWDVEKGTELLTLEDANMSVSGVAISPDGAFLAAAASEGLVSGELIVWDASPQSVNQ
jgi:eukaryotic-like serine/threonine-protein kinase